MSNVKDKNFLRKRVFELACVCACEITKLKKKSFKGVDLCVGLVEGKILRPTRRR